MPKATQIYRLLRNHWFQLGLRIVLGMLFLVAGLAKIFDTAAFAKVISNFTLAPESWVIPLAIFIPYAEVILGLMLLLNFYLRFAIGAGSILLVVFTGVSLYEYVLTGNAADCGCFGKLLARQNNWSLFLENAVMFGALIVSWKFSNLSKLKGETE